MLKTEKTLIKRLLESYRAEKIKQIRAATGAKTSIRSINKAIKALG